MALVGRAGVVPGRVTLPLGVLFDSVGLSEGRDTVLALLGMEAGLSAGWDGRDEVARERLEADEVGVLL